MQNQHLPPEEIPQSAWNRSRTDADARTDLAPSTTPGEERTSAQADLEARRTYTEEDVVLPPEEIIGAEDEALLHKLIRQAHKMKRRRQISLGFYYTGISFYVIYSLMDLSNRLPRLPSYLPILFVLAYASAFTAEIVTRYRWSKSTSKITHIDDMRAVGVLAEAMDIPDKKVRVQAEAALTRLLPRLRPEDAHLLNAAQRTSLYQRLKIENAASIPDFMVAVLEALEKIGDAAALPSVQNLATSIVTTANGTHVKAAAQRCLPILRLRIQTLATSSTLLRASSVENTGSGSLLRPAHEGSDTVPEQLLRASNSDTEVSL